MNNVCFSHNSDEWETPRDLFKLLNDEFKFDIDLFASDKNHLCDSYFTKEEPLIYYELYSGNNIFANPPYSQIAEAVELCFNLSYDNLVVMLLPARTDTKWFHKYLYDKSNVEIRFIKGRLKFCRNGVSMGSAPFPSMICVLKRRV